MIFRSTVCFAILLSLVITPLCVQASGLSLSVTPTLFEMSAKPLQVWESSVRVINPNRQELVVYAEVVNFLPQGEVGHGRFLPVFENFTEGKTLAEWITVPEGPIVIEPEGSFEVPVKVNVPEDASPGGHYAAIMIKTQPPKQEDSFQIGTSQAVTSLFLVRIAGDVVENGLVRTFNVADSFTGLPEATFEVRFENKGNIHLQPQGEIVIKNMWGRERGVIPINHQTHFGNVLPESIRKFEFSWKGEPSFSDIGRYTAELTLAYGTESRKFATQSTQFWVIPVKQVLTVLFILIAIVAFVTWSIKRYVRRMLSLSGVEAPRGAYVPLADRQTPRREGDVVIAAHTRVTAPIEDGVSDLRGRLSKTKAFMDTLQVLMGFAVTYKLFFLGLFGFILSVGLIWQFFAHVMTDQRDYEVTVETPGAERTISSEEIIYERAQEIVQPVETEAALATTSQTFELILTNAGDTPGAAAAMQRELETEGYDVAALRSDFGESIPNTVILYDTIVQEDALMLSRSLDNALLSARPDSASTTGANITVLIGNDFTF